MSFITPFSVKMAAVKKSIVWPWFSKQESEAYWCGVLRKTWGPHGKARVNLWWWLVLSFRWSSLWWSRTTLGPWMWWTRSSPPTPPSPQPSRSRWLSSWPYRTGNTLEKCVTGAEGSQKPNLYLPLFIYLEFLFNRLDREICDRCTRLTKTVY